MFSHKEFQVKGTFLNNHFLVPNEINLILVMHVMDNNLWNINTKLFALRDQNFYKKIEILYLYKV